MKALDVTGTDPNLLIQATDQSIACIGLYFCNYGDTPLTFSVYVVPNGMDVNDNACKFIYNQNLQPGDTFMLNVEKLLLHPGDAIYVQKSSDTSKLSVQLSYEYY